MYAGVCIIFVGFVFIYICVAVFACMYVLVCNVCACMYAFARVCESW